MKVPEVSFAGFLASTCYRQPSSQNQTLITVPNPVLYGLQGNAYITPDSGTLTFLSGLKSSLLK